VRELRSKIDSIHGERQRVVLDIESAKRDHLHAMEEIKAQQTQIDDLQTGTDRVRDRVKKQQQLYEQVRTDRNSYSRSLIEAQAEIDNMKRRWENYTF